jgi:hypothetical protein
MFCGWGVAARSLPLERAQRGTRGSRRSLRRGMMGHLEAWAISNEGGRQGRGTRSEHSIAPARVDGGGRLERAYRLGCWESLGNAEDNAGSPAR